MYLRVYDNRDSSSKSAPSPSLCYSFTHTQVHGYHHKPKPLTESCVRLIIFFYEGGEEEFLFLLLNLVVVIELLYFTLWGRPVTVVSGAPSVPVGNFTG